MERYIQDLFLDLTLLISDANNNDYHDGDDDDDDDDDNYNGNKRIVAVIVSDNARGFKKSRPKRRTMSRNKSSDLFLVIPPRISSQSLAAKSSSRKIIDIRDSKQLTQQAAIMETYNNNISNRNNVRCYRQATLKSSSSTSSTSSSSTSTSSSSAAASASASASASNKFDRWGAINCTSTTNNSRNSGIQRRTVSDSFLNIPEKIPSKHTCNDSCLVIPKRISSPSLAATSSSRKRIDKRDLMQLTQAAIMEPYYNNSNRNNVRCYRQATIKPSSSSSSSSSPSLGQYFSLSSHTAIMEDSLSTMNTISICSSICSSNSSQSYNREYFGAHHNGRSIHRIPSLLAKLPPKSTSPMSSSPSKSYTTTLNDNDGGNIITSASPSKQHKVTTINNNIINVTNNLQRVLGDMIPSPLSLSKSRRKTIVSRAIESHTSDSARNSSGNKIRYIPG